jgi:hypothetical protein
MTRVDEVVFSCSADVLGALLLFAFALPNRLKRAKILLRQLHEKVIAPGPTSDCILRSR